MFFDDRKVTGDSPAKGNNTNAVAFKLVPVNARAFVLCPMGVSLNADLPVIREHNIDDQRTAFRCALALCLSCKVFEGVSLEGYQRVSGRSRLSRRNATH